MVQEKRPLSHPQGRGLSVIQKAQENEFQQAQPGAPVDQDGVILFDGVCNLCNGWVHFVIDRDPDKHFRFAALQSEAGRRVLRQAGLAEDFLDSIVLIDNGTPYLYSTSILKTLKRLKKPWPLLSLFSLVPQGLRDRVYRWVAARRYARFGKLDSCRMPTPDLESRFLK